MQRFILTALVLFTSATFTYACDRPRLFPRLRQAVHRPIQVVQQAAPVRTVLANTAEATGQMIQQAGATVRPTCSNGVCR